MKNRFDEEARKIDARPATREVALQFSRTLKHHVPLSGAESVLDFGCGTGLVGMHLYNDVNSMVMMDSSLGMLEVLKEKIATQAVSNMNIIHGTIDNIIGKYDPFDLIYMSNVLHHIRDVSGILKKN